MLTDSFTLRSEWQKVTSILFSFLTDLNNTLVGLVSIFSLCSKSSCLFTKLFETVPNIQINIGINVNRIFHSFFGSLVRSKYFFYLFAFFYFPFVVLRNDKISKMEIFFFFLLISMTSTLLFWIRWSVCISKSQRILCVLFYWIDFGLCMYHLVE